jgi:hypothetical protein
MAHAFSNKENKNLPPVKTKFNHRIELMLKKKERCMWGNLRQGLMNLQE